MERRSQYPIRIKSLIDLNTDLLLTELQELLGKDRSKIIRLILADFFDRKLDIIDLYKANNRPEDKLMLLEMILKDFLDNNKTEIQEYNEFKKNKSTLGYSNLVCN